jgi:hypothetical protein
MKFIHIPADPTQPMKVVEVEAKQGYDKARELVDGYIQLVRVQGYPRLEMAMDEEGKVFGKPRNVRAMVVAAIGQDIVGDTVVCGKNFTDVESKAPELIATINSWGGTEL